MADEDMIRVESFCIFYEVQPSFVYSLETSGLVQITHEDGVDYLSASSLDHLEKLMRLHHDLGINSEGLEAVDYLLGKINALQAEIRRLRSRLRLYEDKN